MYAIRSYYGYFNRDGLAVFGSKLGFNPQVGIFQRIVQGAERQPGDFGKVNPVAKGGKWS